jgi:hypothetical protein
MEEGLPKSLKALTIISLFFTGSLFSKDNWQQLLPIVVEAKPLCVPQNTCRADIRLSKKLAASYIESGYVANSELTEISPTVSVPPQ